MAYLTKLVQSLEKFPPSCNILLLGDFNLPNVNWNLVAPWQSDTISDFFCDSVINRFGLSQLVNKPTRGDALLDLILTNTPAHLTLMSLFPVHIKLQRSFTITKMQIGKVFALIFPMSHGAMYS